MTSSNYEKFDLSDKTEMLSGPTIYYFCLKCGDTVESAPRNAARCSCRNINVDADAGRISIKDFALAKMCKRK